MEETGICAWNKIFKYHARFLISEGWNNDQTSCMNINPKYMFLYCS